MAVFFLLGSLVAIFYDALHFHYLQREAHQMAILQQAAEVLAQIWHGDQRGIDYRLQTLCATEERAFNPDYLQCVFSAQPYLKVGRGIQVKVLPLQSTQAGEKLFYALHTRANTNTNFAPHYHFTISYGRKMEVLLEVDHDAYLPPRIYALGPQGKKKDLRLNQDWKFDNFGLHLFLDRRLVSNRDIKHWLDFTLGVEEQVTKMAAQFLPAELDSLSSSLSSLSSFSSSSSSSSSLPPLSSSLSILRQEFSTWPTTPQGMHDIWWDLPAENLSPVLMEAYCAFWGGRVLTTLWFDGGSFHPGDYASPRPRYVLRKKYPWPQEQREIGCAQIFSAECRGQKYSANQKSAVSWIGLQQTLGGIPELLLSPTGTWEVKASSYLLPRHSPWHELGKRWNYELPRDGAVGFRCMHYE